VPDASIDGVAREVCTRCRLPYWTHDLWACLPYHMGEFAEDDDVRREVVLRELNQGALAGFQSEVTERAADLVLAALNRYDAWKAAQDSSGGCPT
jgi:hypothetical protein